jgi:hypothetical protein
VTSVVVVVVTGVSATQPANPNSASKQKGILISFLLPRFVLPEQFGSVLRSEDLQQISAIRRFLRDGAAQMESLCPRLGGFGTVERNTGRAGAGLCAQREFFPLLLRTGLSGAKLR